MEAFGNVLYIVLGIVSFALVAFFAWATWNGGKKERKGPTDAPEQPNPTPVGRPNPATPPTPSPDLDRPAGRQ